MTIYNINFGIGWASSGVEYAQSYRAQMLRHLKEDAKFIFLDFIASENIQTLTANLGFQDNEVIWLYQYFTDIPIAPTTYTIDQLKLDVGNTVTRTEVDQQGKVQRLYLDHQSQTFVTCYMKNADQPYVDRAEFVVNGMLIRKDFYNYVRVFSEYYAPYDNYAKLYMRQFYNENGSIAYQEIIDGDAHSYVFNDARFDSKEAFVAYFIQQLYLTHNDIVILDRATDIGQAVLQNKGQSHVGVVVHAEHYSDNITDGTHILWNNYYEYQFNHAPYIDFYIVATDLQNQILSQQFAQYTKFQPRIRTIPVGSLDQLTMPSVERQPYSILTASRLASEKHVDWIALAVIKAKQAVPQLSFDIYGHGPEKDKIQQIISEHHAEDYIHLRGHVNLDEIYTQYELFVSASQSEGFGLTLMEAVGSGLGMIGFNVNYGNPTFISDGQNGYLLDKPTKEESIEEITDRMADKIVQYFNNGPTSPQQVSYDIATPFKTAEMINKWQNLVDEVLYD
ncbi:accessory Sec system glycosyltransferase GtfA [Staphylococcus warneri]|uniref:accessory Sec system glycosyltransferase GtfA n=1 Tax=Staphylococcus warneri TaxID=1292 RepID=UPI001FB26F04|nr:accessory Sec system glycosyltransferase GtfA [Staphylococcus warneri]MCJ1787989.1 accessory Sec system glycosyltransferase GtfA [Staphylococcus warneri]MCJ1790412.1 accessory Sec system glycosyltransferase GtfA [Staphylococcus warneri]MCJ1792811.1 accessory Sec system glycosyltransferase GtfA [Staphylococcus warneri]MCJ1795295.1 accessory Sec system glycosyltransferase GtfA [Staphylococcus warneri]MCJ1797810.1 accessory Sec system glycosyltransferase GtfA [Staphylococcus warneri]